MSQIYRVYGAGDVPKFGPEEHHPDCQRYTVLNRIVDAIGEPTEAQVQALITPPQNTQTPAEKLAAFLQANPDVAALVGA